jgi:hypothetical protein
MGTVKSNGNTNTHSLVRMLNCGRSFRKTQREWESEWASIKGMGANRAAKPDWLFSEQWAKQLTSTPPTGDNFHGRGGWYFRLCILQPDFFI